MGVNVTKFVATIEILKFSISFTSGNGTLTATDPIKRNTPVAIYGHR